MWIMILLLIGAVILQSGDSLFILGSNDAADTLVIAATVIDSASGLRIENKVKVSESGEKYCVYEERYLLGADSLVSTKISFYDEHQAVMLEEEIADGRKISFELSNIYDSMLVVTTWDHRYGKPSLYVVKDEEKQEIVKEGDWTRIVGYKVSANNRFMVFHMRNPYYDKPWDYIYFYDLATGQDWDYLFPSCLSCKKSRIYLEVDNDGRAEVTHKNEHRVFSVHGVLEDIYLKLR
jgi:hypothetical protein